VLIGPTRPEEMNELMDLSEMIRGMAREAKLSARRLRSARSSEKDAALRLMAEGRESFMAVADYSKIVIRGEGSFANLG